MLKENIGFGFIRCYVIYAQEIYNKIRCHKKSVVLSTRANTAKLALKRQFHNISSRNSFTFCRKEYKTSVKHIVKLIGKTMPSQLINICLSLDDHWAVA